MTKRWAFWTRPDSRLGRVFFAKAVTALHRSANRERGPEEIWLSWHFFLPVFFSPFCFNGDMMHKKVAILV